MFYIIFLPCNADWRNLNWIKDENIGIIYGKDQYYLF